MDLFPRTRDALARDGSPMARAVVAIGAATLTGWVAWFALARVDETIASADARLEARQAPHAVDAPVGGRIVASTLAIGRSVAAGELLVELDSADLRLRRSVAEARRTAVTEEIAALEREIAERRTALDGVGRAAEAEAAVAEAHGAQAAAERGDSDAAAARAAKLAAKGLVAKAESARLAAASVKAAADERVWASEAQRIRLAATAARHIAIADVEKRGADLGERRRGLAEAAAEVADLDAAIERHRIRAPIAGRLGDAAPLTPGSVLAEGQRLATVVPDGDLRVVAHFDAAGALGRLKPGQPAIVRLDGFPWTRFGSLHARIATVDGEVRGARLAVVLTLDGATPPGIRLEHGLPAAVEVAVETVSPATLVLREAGLLLGPAAAAAEPAP